MRLRSSKGFSLIEIIVVIGIIATMMGLAVSYFGSSFSTQVKKESAHLIQTVRYVYNLAATQKMTYRIVFDLEKQSYWMEEGGENFILKTAKQEEEEAEKLNQMDVGDEEEDEEGEASPPSFAETDDHVVKKTTIEGEVKIRDVFVAHQEEPITEGKAYLYFFPNGLTERAVIHLSDQEEENNFSVIINPVTGRAQVESYYIEHEKILEQEEE